MLYKRSRKPGSHWWVRFWVKNVEIRQSSGTDRKERAEAFEQNLRAAIWDEENLGIEVHTWDEALARWLREKAHKRSLLRDKQAFAKLGLSGELAGTDAPQGSARDMAFYRSLANSCVKWGWLDKAPRVEIPSAEKSEPRWITKEQFKALEKELPEHAAQLARFAVSTGLRQGNIFRLRWNAVDMGRRMVRVAAGDAKSKKGGGFPIGDDAMAVLERQQGRHKEYVFTDDEGKAPIGSIKTTWLKAVKRAGLKGFRFHDLRHTWAAWHTLSGTPPIILKELGGWASLAMVERYSSLNPGHLADWADGAKIKKARTKTGTSKKRQKRKRLK